MTVFHSIVSLCSGIVTVSAAVMLLVRPVRERLFGWKQIKDAQKCQLRSEILRIYYRNKEDKKIRQYELENVVLLYQAYKALDGNSFVDRVYKEIMTWEVIS